MKMLLIYFTCKSFKTENSNNLLCVSKVGVVWLAIQTWKDMTQNDPSDGYEPDAIETMQVIRIGLVGNGKENLGVFESTEPHKKCALK